MNIQSMTYFRNTYGIEQSITMFHRMRTWYRHQAKAKHISANERAKYEGAAEVMTVYIKAAKLVWVR